MMSRHTWCFQTIFKTALSIINSVWKSCCYANLNNFLILVHLKRITGTTSCFSSIIILIPLNLILLIDFVDEATYVYGILESSSFSISARIRPIEAFLSIKIIVSWKCRWCIETSTTASEIGLIWTIIIILYLATFLRGLWKRPRHRCIARCGIISIGLRPQFDISSNRTQIIIQIVALNLLLLLMWSSHGLVCYY